MNKRILAQNKQTGKTLTFDNEMLLKNAPGEWIEIDRLDTKKPKKIIIEEVKEENQTEDISKLNPKFDIDYLHSILDKSIKDIKETTSKIIDVGTLKSLELIEKTKKNRKSVLKHLSELIEK